MRHRRGFTIIELVVTIALMAMLLGAGMALMRNFGRGQELDAVTTQVQSLVRRARATAMARGTGVELGFELYRNEGAIRSHLRAPITHFHFEDSPADERVVGTAGVVGRRSRSLLVTLGRTGQGIEFAGSAGSQVEAQTDHRFDCQDGVALSADIYLERLTAAQIVGRGLGTNAVWYLGVDQYGFLIGGGQFNGDIVLPALPGDAAARLVKEQINAISFMQPLPLRRWVHVDMVLSARGVRLSVDGVPQLSFVEKVETPQSVLDRRAKSGLQPIIGAQMRLPETFDPASGVTWVYFQTDGRLDETLHTMPVEFYVERPSQMGEDDPMLIDPKLAEQLGTAKRFSMKDGAGAPLYIGAGILGRVDNVQVAALESGDTIILPRGTRLVAQPMPPADPAVRIDRRKLTIERMGTVR